MLIPVAILAYGEFHQVHGRRYFLRSEGGSPLQKRPMPGTNRRTKERNRRKLFRIFLWLFLLVVIALFLRMILAEESFEEGADVVDLALLASPEETATKDEVVLRTPYGDTLIAFMRAKTDIDITREPFLKSESLVHIPAGEYLEVYGSEDGYVKVRYQEKMGYVLYKDLESVDDDTLFKVVRGYLIVNRNFHLPENYRPGVSTVAKIAFEKMREDAAKSGFDLKIYADFEDYEHQAGKVEEGERSMQAAAVNGEPGNEGRPAMSETVPPQENAPENVNGEIDVNAQANQGAQPGQKRPILPGESEHQTGLAFDFWDGSVEPGDAETYDAGALSAWLKDNAYRFGFILRYPKGQEEKTGFEYEPWHYRYVGEELAGKIYQSGLTLEEYFGL